MNYFEEKNLCIFIAVSLICCPCACKGGRHCSGKSWWSDGPGFQVQRCYFWAGPPWACPLSSLSLRFLNLQKRLREEDSLHELPWFYCEDAEIQHIHAPNVQPAWKYYSLLLRLFDLDIPVPSQPEKTLKNTPGKWQRRNSSSVWACTKREGRPRPHKIQNKSGWGVETHSGMDSIVRERFRNHFTRSPSLQLCKRRKRNLKKKRFRSIP